MKTRWTHRYAAAALSVLLLAAAGCKDDDTDAQIPPPDAPVITAVATPKVVDADGGPLSIACEVENPVAGERLAASSDDAWVKELAVSAEGSVVTARLEANPSTEERPTTITLSYKGADPLDVVVLQAARVLPYNITVSGITPSNALIEVFPQDGEAMYIAAVDFADGFDAEATVAENKAGFAAQAEADGKTLADFLAEYAYTGKAEFHPSRLSPKTEYVVYAYGIDAEGNATTEVVTESFTSQPVGTGPMVDCRIDISTENLTATSVDVIFSPTDPSVDYFYTMLDQAGYDDISKDWSGYIYEYMVSQQDKYPNLSLELLVSLSCTVGEKKISSKQLQPQTTYYACAMGVNGDALINTEVAVLKIETPEETPIDYGFDFTVGQPTATGAEVSVSPRDPRAFYYWNVMTQAEYDELNGDETKIAAYFEQKMIDQRKAQLGDYADYYPLPDFIASQCVEGTDSYTFATLTPETTYYVYAFWVDDKTGAPASATSFGPEPFTTPKQVISDVVAEPSPWLTDGDDWAALKPQVYGSYAGKAVLGARIAPDAEAVHWYSHIYAAASIADTSDQMLATSLIGSNYNKDKTSYTIYSPVEWGGDYVIVSVAVDADGNRGEVRRLPFKAEKSAAEKLEAIPE